MKNHTLPSSLLVAAALAVPSLAVAAPVNNAEVTPADVRTAPVDNTLQAEIEGPDGELLATQPGAVETDESAAVSADDMDAQTRTPEAVEAVALDPAQQAPAQTSPQTLNQQHSAPDYEPLIQGEVREGNVTPADNRATPAPITLQEKKKDNRGELIATQPGEVELGESRRITVR